MFCSKCGNEISDDAMFCGNCGAKVNGAMNPYPMQQVSEPYRVVKKKPKKLAIIIGVVIVAVVAAFVWNQNFTYKGVVKKYIKASEQLDMKGIMKCMPKEYIAGVEEEIEEYYDVGIEEWMEDYFAELEDYDDLSISCEVKSARDCTKKEIREEVDYLDEELDVYLDVKKMKEVGIRCVYRFEGESEKNTVNILVGKIGLKWYVIDGEGPLGL